MFDLAQEPLEEASRRAAELLVGFWRGLEARRVDPGVSREELARRFAGRLGDEGVGTLAALEELARDALPASMTTPHPLYLGLINSSPLPAGVLADLIVSGINNNAGAFHQSPAFSTLEDQVLAGFARLVGYPAGWGGLFLPGGSWANLQGLLLARARHFPEWAEHGPRALVARPLVYVSGSAHFSATRAAEAIGLGRGDVIAIPGRGRGELDARALAARIAHDRAEGAAPMAVVATAGTTGTGAIDPIAEVADVCAREGVWLHVDACYGGAALLLPELRARLAGIERADSVSIDPHKWCFVPLTAAILLTRERGLEERAFDPAGASYIPGDGAVDPWRRGLPTSRRASGATTWMALRAHGWGAIREAARSNIALVRLLERRLAAAGFEVLEGGELSTACARWGDDDRVQTAIAADAVASGKTWFATVRHAGRTWLRFNLVNLHTRERHIEELAGLVAETARRLGCSA